MAMRVVTLDKLHEFIDSKLNIQSVMQRSNDNVIFKDVSESRVVCSVPLSQITNINDDVPFLKFRDQVSGVLFLNGNVIPDDEIKPYSYLLD